MGDQTLAEFRDDIVLKLGNRPDVPLTDARLTRWVNDAYLKMAKPSVRMFRELRKSYTITLVADQSAYDINEATLGFQDNGTYSVTYFDTTGDITTVGTRQHALNPRSQRRLDRQTTHNAQPRFYSTESGTTNQLVVYPVPGTAEAGKQIEYKYWAQPGKLVADTDTTILPAEYDSALSFGAIAVTMSHLPGYAEEALLAMKMFQAWTNDSADPSKTSADDWGHRADVRTQSYQESRFNQS